MVRSATAVLALLLVSSPATAQDPAPRTGEVAPRTHTVVAGNTLWKLAHAYYGDAYAWTRIFEANRDVIRDPHRLEPGLVLDIPAVPTGVVRAVTVETNPSPPGGGAPGPEVDPDRPTALEERPGATRTVFYPEPPDLGRIVASEAERMAFSRADFHGAPWIVPGSADPPHLGTVEKLASVGDARHSARPRDRVRLWLTGAPPPLGTRLQAFRTERKVEGLGRIAIPTGTLTVTGVSPEGVVATVDDIFGRVTAGDLIRPLPAFPLTPAMTARPIQDDLRATVVGFAGTEALHNVGDFLFLASGSEQGVRVGDVFEVLAEDGAPGGGDGSVRVITVQEGHATARITAMENPVFETGVVLRLSRRMQ